MAELLSVGLDVGTTTTQLVVSRLTAENRASTFAVPHMEITARQVVYQSPVYFTPLLGVDRVDGEGIRALLAREYRAAGIAPEQVDTGAVIITGETSRKENAETVLHALSGQAGRFVVATAGPDLESILAAKGAGAVEYSEQTPVLHMDIGGGTSNLALCADGRVTATGCLNVGGRLLKCTETGVITYVSPVLADMGYAVGRVLTQPEAMALARRLAAVLEMAAGLREKNGDFAHFTTQGTEIPQPVSGAVLSFSGGVADCIGRDVPWLEYGDLGPLLGRAIRESALCRGAYRLGSQTIRATVIGAGCHACLLSGSTVFIRGVPLPIKDLPVATVTESEQDLPTPELSRLLRSRLEAMEQWGVLALPGWQNPDYAQVTRLADAISAAVGTLPCRIALRWDMAKALGHALALRLPEDSPCLCLDGLELAGQCYLDVGNPVGPAYPVVIKTLVF